MIISLLDDMRTLYTYYRVLRECTSMITFTNTICHVPKIEAYLVPFSDFSMNSKQKNMSANFRFLNFCSYSLMHFLDEVYEFGMNF